MGCQSPVSKDTEFHYQSSERFANSVYSGGLYQT
jgi:hypothetical protein